MQYALTFCKQGEWREITPAMRSLLSVLFETVGQTKLVEDCNQLLRDRETRDAPSKALARFSSWATPVDHGLLQRHGRADIEVNSSAAVDPNFEADRIFVAKHTTDDASDKGVPLRKVLGAQKWTTYNAQTVRETYSHIHLFLHARRNNCWQQVGNFWMVQLLPEFQLFRDTRSDRVYFTIKVFEAAAVAWPMVQVANNMWRMDMTVTQLTWFVLLDLDSVQVMTAKVMSPVRMSLSGWSPSQDSTLFESTGPAEGLLPWLGRSGFRGIQEHTLKKLMSHLAIPRLELADAPDMSASDGLALAIMRWLSDELDMESAIGALAGRRRLDDQRSGSYVDDLTEEAVLDVAIIGDQREMKAFVKDHSVQKKLQWTHSAATKKFVEKLWGKMEVLAKSGAAARAQHKIMAEEAEKTKVARAAWRAKLLNDPKKMVLESKPVEAHCLADELNGRFLLSYPGERRKSFSWTTRGVEEAAQLSLSHMWRWAEKHTGAQPPPEVDLTLIA